MIYMNVSIQIYFISNENEILQRASIPLRGRTKVKAGYDWWRQIKREMPYGGTLQKIIADGDEDITEEVLKLEKALLDN